MFSVYSAVKNWTGITRAVSLYRNCAG